MWYVYFLQLNNADIYGSTNDLKRRVASHQTGQVNSTRTYLPATLNPMWPSKRNNTRESSRIISIRLRKGDRAQAPCKDPLIASEGCPA